LPRRTHREYSRESSSPVDAREALHDRDVVERDVEVAQVLQVLQVLQPRDDVVLQVQDAQLAAERADDLDALQLQLVQ
jgi:hypothetical protein